MPFLLSFPARQAFLLNKNSRRALNLTPVAKVPAAGPQCAYRLISELGLTALKRGIRAQPWFFLCPNGAPGLSPGFQPREPIPSSAAPCKGARSGRSIPDIAFIKSNAMFP